MLFFQLLLLGGYLYSHLLSTKLNSRQQAVVHLSVVCVSLLVIIAGALFWKTPLLPGPAWKPISPENPVWHILVLLAATVGLPYLVLSTTGPLLQNWFFLAQPGRSPYRLYALSNIGSLLGLITYPFVFEPAFRLHAQAWGWCAGYLVFVTGSFACAFGIKKQLAPAVPTQDVNMAGSPSSTVQLFWFLLPMVASVMLLATTNLMCQEIAVIPFLWVVPLVLYLLTFVICFDSQKWYRRGIFHTLFGLALPVAVAILMAGTAPPVFDQICMLSVVLFACCMVCHGELVRLKPAPIFLTRFYLLLSAGGAAGGIFVALVAPRIFKDYREFQYGLIASVVLVILILVHDRQSWWYGSKTAIRGIFILLGLMLVPHFFSRFIIYEPMVRAMGRFQYYPLLAVMALLSLLILWRSRKQSEAPPPRINLAQIASGIVLVALSLAFYHHATMFKDWQVRKDRNFYGTLRVEHASLENIDAYVLLHGQTVHGAQYREFPKTPTAYYGSHSGIGLFLTSQPACVQPCSRLYGVVGMGVGTLAAYGQAGETMRFYEINPRVIDYSQANAPYFTFLRDSAAKTEIELGDGRLTLEREFRDKGPQKFDVLILDAFNSDSVPVHLLTEEAFHLYLAHLRGPDSVLAFNVTNKSVDLRPVLLSHAMHNHMNLIRLCRPQGPRVDDTSDWILLSRNHKMLELLSFQGHVAPMPPFKDALRWTDDYSNLFQVLRKR